jgi:hypothetical protein
VRSPCAAIESVSTRNRKRRRRRRALGRPRLRQDGLARYALLEQQLRRLDPGIGVEARDECVVADDVGHRHKRHALVVREPRADDGRPRHRVRRRVDVAAARVVIERLVEAEPALEPEAREPLEVFGRGGRCDEARERRGVGSNDQLGAQASLEAESRDAEGPVLIVALAIGERVRRLGDPPGHPALPAVVDLAPHARAAALIQQRSREGSHQELRHQVLEHRAAPRHQRGAAAYVGDEASEMKPVMLGDVALRDRHEAGQPCFRGQQVVEGGIEPSGTLGIGEPVSD